MAGEHGEGELSKLGIRVSLATISRYLPRAQPDPKSQQRWTTFLRNHRDAIAAMDFLVVPTVRFKLLYIWFAIDHGRRRVLAFNVTASPTALWVSQRLCDAFSEASIHRFLIYDNDAIFNSTITEVIERLGSNPSGQRSRVRGKTARRSASSARFAGSSSTMWWFCTRIT